MVSYDLIQTAMEAGTDGEITADLESPKEKYSEDVVTSLDTEQSVDLYFAIKNIVSNHFYDSYLFDSPEFNSFEVMRFINSGTTRYKNFPKRWYNSYRYFLDYFTDELNSCLWRLKFKNSIDAEEIVKWARKFSSGDTC